MGIIRENPVWEEPIYLIERYDPVMGGEYGINNVQARKLANRTQFLRSILTNAHDPDGRHALTNADVADAAAIEEAKLALPVSTEALYDQYLYLAGLVAQVNKTLDGVEGLDESPLRAIYDAMLLTWAYGYPRFAFELFAGQFTLRDDFEDVPLIETINGDDSIDVVNSDTVVLNDPYVILDNDGSSRLVTVKDVLTDKRVILWETEGKTRRHTGILTKCSWKQKDGKVLATPGAAYITKYCTMLEGFKRGKLLIGHTDPAQFRVTYRAASSTTPTNWQECPLTDCTYSEEFKLWRSVYEVPGGTVAFRIEALAETVVDHIVLMTDSQGTLPSTIRTPEVLDDDFTVVRFGAIYQAKHTGTEIQLASDVAFTQDVESVKLGPNTDPSPIWKLKNDVLAAHPMVAGDRVLWRVRYTADDGYTSLWSTSAVYEHA